MRDVLSPRSRVDNDHYLTGSFLDLAHAGSRTHIKTLISGLEILLTDSTGLADELNRNTNLFIPEKLG